MNKQDLLQRKAEIEKEIQELPYISTVDEDGEINEDAYQEKLEQNYYSDELREQLRDVNRRLAVHSLGQNIYSRLGGDPEKY